MKTSKFKKSLAICIMGAVCHPSIAQTLFSNGFETDTSGWITAPTRVASGTDAITSSSGSFHATAATNTGEFTRWGGYNYGAGAGVVPAFTEYWTSIDIYLNVSGGWSNGTQFDYSSAINGSSGTHLRDFIFTAGFYNDSTGPGAGSNRFVITASNNSPGDPKNPARSPTSIATTGWYTFEHHFYDNGGVLAVDMNISDSSDALVGTWTLSTPADVIPVVGGNRYGWFVDNGFSSIAIDNSEMKIRTASVPDGSTTVAMLGAALAGLAALRRKFARA